MRVFFPLGLGKEMGEWRGGGAKVRSALYGAAVEAVGWREGGQGASIPRKGVLRWGLSAGERGRNGWKLQRLQDALDDGGLNDVGQYPALATAGAMQQVFTKGTPQQVCPGDSVARNIFLPLPGF